MKCGCRMEPGRRLGIGEVRKHFEHVQAALEEAGAEIVLLEVIVGLNRDDASREALMTTRNHVIHALQSWNDVTRPALDRVVPANPIAEALGL